jgi:putative transposase
MDGKGSYRDKLFIERLWRTVKYEEGYLKAYQNGKDARIEISDYFHFYNTARPHQALGYRTQGDVFTSIPFEEPEKSVIESLTTSTIDAAGLYLGLAPLLS